MQGYYAIVWDTISNFYDETRRREGNWIFEGKLEQMNRYYAVEAYAKRLRIKQAETLRRQVEVLCHVQLPAQLFKVGVESGNKTISRVHTTEEKASYN